jgi:hypothetical protein
MPDHKDALLHGQWMPRRHYRRCPYLFLLTGALLLIVQEAGDGAHQGDLLV